jgi:hypothetical protein
MISILLNSRAKDYNNPGSLDVFLNSLYSSLHNIENVEIIFKFDLDDDVILNQIIQLVKIYPDLQIKYVVTPRYYYTGLHIGYYECFKLVNKKSKLIICVADDFLFNKKNWDQELLDQISSFNKNDLYTVQDFIGDNTNSVPICPMWSPKIIEICEGFGPVFATDAWSMYINKFLLSEIPSNVIIYNANIQRITNELDGPSNIRWHTDRKEALEYLASEEFNNYIEIQLSLLKTYLYSNK